MARKVFSWKRITVVAHVVSERIALIDDKEQRILTFALTDKTSGSLPVSEDIAQDKIVGTRVRLTLEKVDGEIVVKNIDTEKTPEFTDVDIAPLGIFPSKK